MILSDQQLVTFSLFKEALTPFSDEGGCGQYLLCPKERSKNPHGTEIQMLFSSLPMQMLSQLSGSFLVRQAGKQGK